MRSSPDSSDPNPPSWSHHFPRRAAWREYYRSGRRPPWWPENEEWPPKPWRHTRGRFFRRMGCFFFAVVFLAFMGLLGILRFALAPFLKFSGHPPFDRPDLIVPFGFVGFILLVFAFVWGMRSWRRMSAPLDEMLQASQRVADGDYSVRVEEKGPPEIYSLARSFNTMAERLHLHDQQRRNMLADVSHELRTPITVIQGNVEGILDGLYPADEAHLKSIIEETQILSHLVDDLRTLALAESGALRLKREPTNLAELIRAVVSELQAQVKEKEIRTNFSLVGGDEFQVDPQRIHEVLTNLLS
ncbi:MAG TPA: HAMP domain-containing protein, partial [Anaerolineales bacterium]|nr:HAMP domain-containing protein [Anaerolineales bacterium]